MRWWRKDKEEEGEMVWPMVLGVGIPDGVVEGLRNRNVKNANYVAVKIKQLATEYIWGEREVEEDKGSKEQWEVIGECMEGWGHAQVTRGLQLGNRGVAIRMDQLWAMLATYGRMQVVELTAVQERRGWCWMGEGEERRGTEWIGKGGKQEKRTASNWVKGGRTFRWMIVARPGDEVEEVVGMNGTQGMRAQWEWYGDQQLVLMVITNDKERVLGMDEKGTEEVMHRWSKWAGTTKPTIKTW
jgi:hypothetical protein